MLPPALAALYAVKVRVSFPGGMLIVSVHVHGPLPGQFPEPKVTLNGVGWTYPVGGLLSATLIDNVDGETYAGRRAAPLVLDGVGIVTVSVAWASVPADVAGVAVAAGAGGCGSALCEPPPHAASDSAATLASIEERVPFPSRFMDTNPQPLQG